jgi:hypothetical protein
MKPSKIRARPDQIAELTRGLQLPLAKIGSDHLNIIAERLLQAFNEVRVQSPTTVASGSETEVTTLMESRLLMMIEQDNFWRQLVLCVGRGKESLSFDGSHLEKRPDLSIYLSNRTLRFPLIVEAKVLDLASGRTETLYCDDGLRRFIDGEYAWGNREAFMIAYVRDGSSINKTLKPFLSAAMTRVPPGYMVKELPNRIGNSAADLARSQHGRTFVYPNQPSPTNQPGTITIWHLWLS